VCDIVVKRFKFTSSSPDDEFLVGLLFTLLNDWPLGMRWT